ncbi:MAG: Na+/H+ antiporter NhaA, partial [Actinobacteria bacterium]|nr:Na+/H+ antiporter NhaA [Actinomycetota bacterium]
DDVAAIAVIAIAYTDHLSLAWLGLAIAGLLGVAAMRALGVRRVLAYLPLGAFVWIATFESGVHATLAGVALALLTPATPIGGRDVLGELEHRLHPWVNLGILPLFALANAGVKLGGGELSDPAGRRIAVAVALGLVVGKFLGIGGATLAALRLGLGALPSGVDRRGLLGAAALGGIGFTVSLFITPLAYEDPLLIGAAKLGILGGSVIAATIGVAIFATRRGPSTPASAPDP